MSKRPIRIRTSRYNREYGATVPTKKCPKKKRRRDLATNHNKQHHDESQASDDNAHNEAGTLDDRQVESSAHSSVNQEPSHQDSTPQHEEEYYHKNAFAMDKSHPEPIEDNDKHETIKDAENNTEHSTVSDKTILCKDAENNTEHSTVSDKSEAEQSQQPKPYFATGANQANTSKDKHDDVTVKQDKDESKDHHSSNWCWNSGCCRCSWCNGCF